jgi:predicted Zn-dependent protease
MVRLKGRAEGYRAAAVLASAWLSRQESYDLRRAVVEVALERRALDAARAELRELMTRYPADSWGLEKRIGLGIHEGDWPSVIGAAESRLRQAPGESRWLAVLALAYRQSGEMREAEEYARRAGLPWPLPEKMVLEDPLGR